MTTHTNGRVTIKKRTCPHHDRDRTRDIVERHKRFSKRKNAWTIHVLYRCRICYNEYHAEYEARRRAARRRAQQ